MLRAAYFSAASAVILCLQATVTARAAGQCPAPPKHVVPAELAAPEEDHRIHIESDDALLTVDGHAVVSGHVKVRQDDRIVSADSVVYDEKTGKVTVKGSVNFENPKVRIDSDSGAYDTIGAGSFDEANFQIFDRNGRGFAREIALSPDGKLDMTEVRYTTCPPGKQDWMLQATSINLDTAAQQGVGRGVVMRFQDVPIFYTPYLSFPLGDERKSGVLFPTFGHTGNNGFELDVPYYFNMAPNYDLTLTPGVLTARGVQLGGEFRYLTAASTGRLETNFLPNDAQTHSDRSYLHYTDVTNLAPGLRLGADISNVSDINYFADFAVGSEQTSVTYLERRTDLKYYDDVWRIRAQLQNWQTIDNFVDPTLRPYSRVPAVEAEGLMPLWGSPLEFLLNGEAVNFLREVGPTGVRLDVSPELRWSSRGPGYFLEPAVGYHFTQYDLKNAGPGEPSTPTRSLPYARLDTGLLFERDAGANGQRAQTLEPRIMYSYVPYRNQDNLPIFDTGLPDLNLTELFRTNRYVGDDRISDANQVALAMTTRLFDQTSGAEYLAATLGQIHYFTPPRVDLPAYLLQNPLGTFMLPPPRVNMFTLPGNYSYVMSPNGMLGPNLVALPPGYYNPGYYGNYNAMMRAAAGATGLSPAMFGGSDLVAEVALTGYRHWNVDMDYQWNPYTSQTDKSEISLQYHPDPSRVVNLGYRFQTGILKEWDGSFAWPITDHWSSVGRWVYSIPDKQTIEQVAGVAYKSCCWRLELVQRRYLTNRLGGLDTSIALQLELTGLSSVGKPADSFLEQEIRGYTSRPSSQLP